MLLLVLLMLSLFLAAGAMLLTVATRARDASRATAAYVQPLALNDEAARAALDQALMALLRGSTSGSNGSIMTGTFCENILADKYGESRSFQGSALSGTTSPVPTLTITATSGDLTTGTGAAPRLNGRILTIKPRPGQGDVMSFRILNAVATSASSATCYLAQLPSRSSPTFVSSTMSFDVIVNGREFTPGSGTSTPEAYDAFDDANKWLAKPSLNALQTGSFGRLSISGSAIQPPTVDNDNDGVPDGVWVSGTAGPGGVIGTVVPPQPSPLGGSVSYDVSYLILDLDGRININTAGMARPAAGSYAGTPDAPLGMGYGPADIDASLVVAGDLPSPSGTSEFTGSDSSRPPGKWTTILLSGSPSNQSYQTTYRQRRMPPLLGTIQGRYGANNVSGTSGDDVDDYQRTSAANYPLLIAGSNAVGDLQGQLKVYMQPPPSSSTDLTPTLSFVAVASGTDAVDDPYEVRLDADAPRFGTARRPAAAAGNDDSPFTVAELERVLRANDPDASQLPARLAAALEDRAQAVRMTITTESWDSPALTGTAARLVEDLVGGAGAGMLHDPAAWASGSNSLSPDISAGLRFNINRPLLSGTSVAARNLQHRYCKGIYTLALVLGETNKARAAQWAVNVLDFRDDDSNITGFEYDTNLANGWNVDGDCGTTGDPDRAVVWGVERPEVVIAEVAAWREPLASQPDSQLFVNLHRPACNAVTGTAAPGNVSVTGTTERSRLTAANGVLHLSATTSGTSAVWQMVISPSQTGGSGTVQFVVPPAAGVMGSTTGVAQLAASGSGAYLCVTPASPQNFSVNTIPTFAITTGGTFGFLPTSASGTVQLQRLANPTAAWSATTNPYITVDEAAIDSIPQKMPPPSGAFVPPLFKNRRRMPADGGADTLTGFWRRDWLPDAATSALGRLSVSGSTLVAWFHWPNRPFVSVAELALVPADDATTMLKNYAFPTTSLASGTTPASLAMLDATHVPTLFAGHALTVSGSAVSSVGLDVLGMHQMSKWREPGRVNVNTILSGTTAVDEVVWAALVGGTQTMLRTGTITTNPFTTVGSGSLSPATSFAQLLSVSSSGQQPPAQRVFASGTSPRAKNPFLAYDVPIRLANTATIRSNVFAVWITVRVTDDSPNAGPPIIKRLFAIVDRSIPVGYSPGSDLNVRDCIRLSRYLD